MVVVHTFYRLGTYMNICFLAWTILVAIAVLVLFGLLIYDAIYEYVSYELDHCNYFGEDKNG